MNAVPGGEMYIKSNCVVFFVDFVSWWLDLVLGRMLALCNSEHVAG